MRVRRGLWCPTKWSSAWEQRKLGELGSLHRGKRFTADDFVDEGGCPLHPLRRDLHTLWRGG